MCVIWVAAYYKVGNEYLIPSLPQSVKSLFACFTEKSFWVALGYTFLRTLEAFVLSFVLAALCAVLSTISKIFCAILKPFMVLLRTLPTLAVILLLLIWTNPLKAPVIVTVLVLFPMIYARIATAIGEVDYGLTEMAEVYGVKKRDRLFKIYLPLISPNLFSQAGADVSLGLKIMVSAEVLANTYKSLGGLMQNARQYLDMPRLAALTIAAILIGLITDIALSQLSRITDRWSKKEDAF